MKKLLLPLLFSIISINAFAQVSPCNREIVPGKEIFTTVYNYCDVKLDPNQLLDLLSTNPQLANEVNSMRLTYLMEVLTKGVGSVMIAYPLYDLLADSPDVNWELGAVGLGLIAVSIPFDIRFKKKAREAIDTWNGEISYNESNSLNLKLALAPTSVGFRLEF